MTRQAGCEVVELSALRQSELLPMLDALNDLDLSHFSYVSVHAPSKLEPGLEAGVAARLSAQLWRQWPIIVHPDAIHDFSPWRDFGKLLCIENMDKRKPIGRTAKELGKLFEELPEASLCFDIGHARQCDPTMTEAYLILREFGSKLCQVHVSEVNTSSKHDCLSFTSILAFQKIAHLIPENIPLILETPVSIDGMEAEMAFVREALPVEQLSLIA